MRNIVFGVGEYYHVFNRSVERRLIVEDSEDSIRFIKSLVEFNCVETTGGLYEISIGQNNENKKGKPLVEIIAYCLNPNHFHLILKQVTDKGISRFMHRFIGGYSKYFNNKNKRKGTLFEGPYKAKHIGDNDYLLHVSAYVNLNDRVHQLSNETSCLVRSSWEEYTRQVPGGTCRPGGILEQFASPKEYENFALSSLELMLEKRPGYKELTNLLFD